jgi:uncharacterized protein YceK
MSRSTAISLAAGFACALGGCGTARNLSRPEKTVEAPTPRPAPNQVYGGVGIDARVGASWLAAPYAEEYGVEVGACERLFDTTCKTGIGIFVLGVDLPLSAVGDTLSLPITVPATLQNKNKPSAPADAGKDKDGDADGEGSGDNPSP